MIGSTYLDIGRFGAVGVLFRRDRRRLDGVGGAQSRGQRYFTGIMVSGVGSVAVRCSVHSIAAGSSGSVMTATIICAVGGRDRKRNSLDGRGCTESR